MAEQAVIEAREANSKERQIMYGKKVELAQAILRNGGSVLVLKSEVKRLAMYLPTPGKFLDCYTVGGDPSGQQIFETDILRFLTISTPIGSRSHKPKIHSETGGRWSFLW